MDCEVRIIIPIVDTKTATVIHRIDRTIPIPSGNLSDALNELPNVVSQETPAAQQVIEFEQAEPVVPTPTLTLDKEVAQEGETVMATLVTTEIDGTPAGPGHYVRVEHASDTGSIAQQEGMTDAQGAFLASFPVFAGSRAGIVQGFFRRQTQQREWASNEKFYTAIPSNSSQSLRITQPYPVPSLKPGEQAEIRVEVLSTVSGLPIPQLAGIQASAQNGNVSPSSGSTDGNGIATFTFTAGSDNGLGKAIFQRQISGPGVDPTVIRSVWSFSVTSDAVLNVNTSGNQASGKTAPTGVDPNRAVSVTADLRIGDDRIAGLPVQFTLDGQGAVAVVDAATDPSGLAESFFLPPLEGMGTSTLCGRSVIDGIPSMDCVDIDYEPARLAFTAREIDISQSNREIRNVNDLGQVIGRHPADGVVLWLPEPAYGLGAGWNALGTFEGEDQPNAINDSGQIVGGDFPGWIWQTGSFTSLTGLFPVDTFAEPLDINENAEITGGACFAQDCDTKAFVLAYPGNAVALNTPAGEKRAGGWSINDLGQVAGWTVEQVGGPLKGAVWLSGPASGQVISDKVATHINEEGQVLLVQAFEAAEVWEGGQTTTTTILATAAGERSFLNDLGWVAGKVFTTADRALWIDGETFLLNNLIESPNGIPPIDRVLALADSGYIVARGGGKIYLLEPVGGPIQ